MMEKRRVVVSPSLIRKPPPLEEMDEEYRAKLKEWMGDWYPEESATENESTIGCTVSHRKEDKENEPGPNKRSKLTLSLNKAKKKRLQSESGEEKQQSRFASPLNEQELDKFAEGLKPANTEASTLWAVNNFTKWAENRQKLAPHDPVPDNLLECHNPATVCKYLCMFVVETRKENGDKYPPATIRSLLSGINRKLQENKAPFSVFDKQNPAFTNLFKTLDVMSSTLHREGVGATKRHAEVISVDHEQTFWDNGMLGYSTPRILQRTVFFYVGMHYALRGVDEQYSLVPHQFTRSPPDSSVYNANVYYEYTEFISKNNQHRYKDINMKNKVSEYLPRWKVTTALLNYLTFTCRSLNHSHYSSTCVLWNKSLMMANHGTLVNGLGLTHSKPLSQN